VGAIGGDVPHGKRQGERRVGEKPAATAKAHTEAQQRAKRRRASDGGAAACGHAAVAGGSQRADAARKRGARGASDKHRNGSAAGDDAQAGCGGGESEEEGSPAEGSMDPGAGGKQQAATASAGRKGRVEILWAHTAHRCLSPVYIISLLALPLSHLPSIYGGSREEHACAERASACIVLLSIPRSTIPCCSMGPRSHSSLDGSSLQDSPLERERGGGPGGVCVCARTYVCVCLCVCLAPPVRVCGIRV